MPVLPKKCPRVYNVNLILYPFFFLIKSATICRKRDELKVLSRHEGWSLQNNKPEETGFPESRPSELLDVTC